MRGMRLAGEAYLGLLPRSENAEKFASLRHRQIPLTFILSHPRVSINPFVLSVGPQGRSRRASQVLALPCFDSAA
jgi:hypothetical protein